MDERRKLVEFARQFFEDVSIEGDLADQDAGKLLDLLRKMKTGVLNWLIEGSKKKQSRRRLPRP